MKHFFRQNSFIDENRRFQKQAQRLKTNAAYSGFMADLNKDEKEFIRTFVERELREIEKHEHDFAALLGNSPFLSQLHTRDRRVEFLASQERYHQFLKSLLEKLK